MVRAGRRQLTQISHQANLRRQRPSYRIVAKSQSNCRQSEKWQISAKGTNAQRNGHKELLPRLESFVSSIGKVPVRVLLLRYNTSTYNGQPLRLVRLQVPRKVSRSLHHAPSSLQRPSSVGITPVNMLSVNHRWPVWQKNQTWVRLPLIACNSKELDSYQAPSNDPAQSVLLL